MFVDRFIEDPDHVEFAWLVTRCLWGDLQHDIGPDTAAKIAKQALAEGATIRETVIAMGYVERGDLTEEQLDAALDVDSMTGR